MKKGRPKSFHLILSSWCEHPEGNELHTTAEIIIKATWP
jgi:hypothetical protein